MEKRSLISYEHYRDALQRFEYFLIGVIGALCAFIVHDFKPTKLDVNPTTLELLSLILFLFSFYFSIKRAENKVL